MKLKNKGFYVAYAVGLMLYSIFCFYPDISFPEFMFCVLGLNVAWLASVYLITKPPLLGAISIKHLSIPSLLLAAIIFRLPALLTEPLFEDDHFRYLWEGFLSAEGYNPYLLAPADFFGRALSLEMSAVLDAVAYPEYTSVYGGAAQAMFSFAYRLDAGELWPLKLIVFCAELVLLTALYYRLSPRYFVLFAFCPLLIHSMTINLHVDIIALALVALALQCWHSRREILCGLLLGIACSIKIYLLVLIPLFLLPRHPSELRPWRNLCGVGVGACLAYFFLEMPFLVAGPSAIGSAISASENWAFNNPLYYLLYVSLGAAIAKLCFLSCFIVSYTYLFFRSWKIEERALGCFSVLLIFSPVLNAWYFAWVLLFAAYGAKALWPWVAAITLWLSYCSGINLVNSGLGLYEIPWSLMLLEWMLPVSVFLWERQGRGGGRVPKLLSALKI